ncbi:hypothetical protein [Streptomyces violens]|uniref:hypothetical protein n=1 Tax=Streptomyces violens TaxID=66377 RepID=UPI000562C2F9|nr:hypothetical protein [Streptomyces violens]
MLIARSALEAHLYMDLHPCECGVAEFARQHSLQERAGALVSVYEGACAGCGRQRQFAFEMAEETPPPPPAFGGPTPSRIIDPGQFKAVAARITTRISPEMLRTPAAERRQFRPQAVYALAATEEVLKFFAEGQDRLPAEAFHSELGRAMYDKDPGKFARDLVESDIELKRQILADIDKVSPPLS